MSPDLVSLFLKSLVIGLSIAVPVGPIAVLCIQRTLMQGVLIGLASGFGAALADALYGGIAGFGLTLISQLMITSEKNFGLAGGLFLCYVGVKTFKSAPKNDLVQSKEVQGLVLALTTTFLLTLANPMTILLFTAVFSGFGYATHTQQLSAGVAMVCGVFVGSLIWWTIVCVSVDRLCRTLRVPINYTVLNRISGAIIAAFGGIALLRSLFWRT